MKSMIKKSLRWSISVGILSFLLGSILTVVSTSLLAGVSWGIGMLIVLFFVFLGILFDMIGIASTAADEVPFRSMAAKKVSGARQGIFIIRNADKVSSFCNDVIGDISGIMSGTATAYVVLQIMMQFHQREGSFIYTATSVLITSLVAALTVGGKAFGKAFAIHYALEVILWVGKIINFFEHQLGIAIINRKKKKKDKT